MKSQFLILLLATLFLGYSCKDADDASNGASTDEAKINEWIKDEMDYWYYWNEEIPAASELDFTSDPEDFFESLLYTSKDRWSYITDDYTELLTSSKKSSQLNMGYMPYFVVFSNQPNRVYIIVLYVEKGSPAEEAGLERGNLISQIDGEKLTTINYYEKYAQTSYTLSYYPSVYPDDNETYQEQEISLSSASYTASPVLCDSVYTVSNSTLGYVALSEFSYSTAFSDPIAEVFADFAAKNVSDVIVDLRYNGGGYLTSAQWLTSNLAPASNVLNEDVLVRLSYNSIIEELISEEDKTIYFDASVSSLNPENVIFLTADGTASASELSITGLMPYVNTLIIGDTTVGKNVGSIPIYMEDDEERFHQYGIQPIVLQYANAEGYTDFTDGLIPDIALEENITNLYAFGDADDPLLNAAFQLFDPSLAKSSVQSGMQGKAFRALPNPVAQDKRKLLFELNKK